MKNWRRILSALLSLALLAGGTASVAEGETPLSQAALAESGAKVYTHGDRVTFVEGSCAAGPIADMAAAAGLVADMTGLLGGDARTRFEPWRTLTDTRGNRYYVFQQMYAGTTVSGGAVKVVADAGGNMLGLVSSVESELPDIQEAEGITAGAAEERVLAHALETQGQALEPVPGRTEKTILPVNLELDMESEAEKEESRYVWVVYTDNPSVGVTRGTELPYLAHYVTMDGEYLYSLPTIFPGDAAGTAGFDAAYVFEFMEPAEYTGRVKLADGSEREISVTLMRDRRTGMYYMGNVERRIAVADCYDFLYDRGRVMVEASLDNTGWDDTCLLALYNYCRAWDYYHEIGWNGGDGLGTPILILKDYCDKDHNPVDNAAYAGRYYGWQVFLSSSANQFSQALDVLAHEFTHCVTGSVMTYNAYKNDHGAINEAMSDIQGNICDLMHLDAGEAEDEGWLIGEDVGEAIRSMEDPHRFHQPEYAWDLYYTPAVRTPTAVNDRGGVHTNSSLLNNVAYRLCAEGGMTLEEARAFWFAVDCAMVPGTDYAQLSELLPWVLKNLGLDRYADALDAALDATRLRTDAMPDAFDDGRALVTLTLPEEERFMDGNWTLFILSVDVDGLNQRMTDIVEGNGAYAGALDALAEALGLPETADPDADPVTRLVDRIEALVDAELEETAEDEENRDALKTLVQWAQEYLGDMLYYGNGSAGQDGRTVRMVCRPGLTIPLLVQLEMDGDSVVPKSLGLAAYTFGAWFDLTEIIGTFLTSAPEESGEAPADLDEMGLGWLDDILGDLTAAGEGTEADGAEAEAEMDAMLKGIMDLADNLGWVRNLVFYTIKPGQVNAIPATGIESVTLLEEADLKGIGDIMDEMKEAAEAQTQPDAVAAVDLSAMSLEELKALQERLEAELGARDAA